MVAGVNEMKLPVVIELDKSVAVLDDDFADASVAFEEPFEVPLPRIAGDVANIHSLTSRHLEYLIEP